ncbi:MAG: MBL fold metallo-hydrolase [Burkholderiaceae bacterium]
MKTWNIGSVRITQIVESGGTPTSSRFLFANGSSELVKAHPWLLPHFATPEGKLLMSIHAFVIESQGQRIVVDTCVGNDKKRASEAWNMLNGPFLQDLEQAGLPADSIDTVLCTHLHVDHVGWNTRLVDGRWVPTFPNARYLFARTEWEHWSNEPVGPTGDEVISDSVRPIVDAGLADLVESDHRITDEVWLEPTPGHTPGHVSVRIASDGHEAVITGDLMHHPIQCSIPDEPVQFDWNGDAARATRRGFLTRYCDCDVMVLGTHFAAPTAGWFTRDGEAWRFAVEKPET